ncbi:MAG: hypothetical protein JJ896_03710 [Rhodothermales bacterium]|nr:hypothetical protein [Rhodothermales bacterium]MBO6778741.1 hypothetical protein [Rhodothermales bacterium]
MTAGFLLVLAALAIVLILVQVSLLRIPAFVALMVATIGVALLAGIPAADVAQVVQDGMGSALGYIAVVIGLGAMFGGLLERSGGAHAMADALLDRFGPERAPWALAISGIVIATPVFFDVAVVLLMPLAYAVSRDARRPLLFFAVPMIAGIGVAHAFIPPTPGPVAVAALLGADLGLVLLFGLVAGFPAMAVGGILFARWITPRITPELELPSLGDPPSGVRPVSALTAASVLALPLVLIVSGSIAKAVMDIAPGWLVLLSHPFSALIMAVLLSLWAFGLRAGIPMAEVSRICTKALEPVGLIILVTGAGGALGKVLVAAGASDVIAGASSGAGAPTLVLAFLVAAAVRVVQGSATVAMITAAGLVSPLLLGASGVTAALATIAIACGATVVSHVNDSGFWLVGRYTGLSERQNFWVWTVASTLIGVSGFAVVLLLAALL